MRKRIEWKFIRILKSDYDKLEAIRKKKMEKEKKPVYIYEVVRDLLKGVESGSESKYIH